MNQRLTFERMAEYGTIAEPPRKTPWYTVRSRQDGAEFRERLIAAGVIRAEGAALKSVRSEATFLLDAVALDEAAALIFATCASGKQLEERIEQAEPRIAARLEALRARHGVRGAA
jgi:hypothetical protein